MPRTATRSKPTEPHLTEMPNQRMATVRTTGDPNITGGRAFPALYGAVYKLKFTRKKAGLPDFKVLPPRARWPDAHLLPKDQWSAIWGIPIPDDVTDLPQPDPATPVTAELWEYGPVAEVLHLGPYTSEEPTIARLHAFIAEQGLTIAGPHEEEYVTRPQAKAQKTVIRYRVQ